MKNATADEVWYELMAILEEAEFPLSTTDIINRYWSRVEERGITPSFTNSTCVYSALTRMCDAECVVRSHYRNAAQKLGMKPALVPPNNSMSIYWGLLGNVGQWRSYTDPETLLAERDIEKTVQPGYSPEPTTDRHSSKCVPLVTDVGWHVVGEAEGVPVWQWRDDPHTRVLTRATEVLLDIGAGLDHIHKLELDQAHDFIITNILGGRSGMFEDYWEYVPSHIAERIRTSSGPWMAGD